MTNSHLSIHTSVLLACQWEVTTPKPGNVHRGADFEDVTFGDFLTSAAMIAPILAAAPTRSLGENVWDCVSQTEQMVGTNTNLGIVLLLTPLAMVPREELLSNGVKRILAVLSADDARLVYEAIGIAKPGGLGTTEQMDVQQKPPADLLAAMGLAAERDAIAQQYVTNFAMIFEEVVPLLLEGNAAGQSLTASIIRTHLTLLARYGDSLIGRKCGQETNVHVQRQATYCLESIQHGEEAYHAAIADFDFWLRADGHKRNPGTTADLIAAGLFVVFRDGRWEPPWK